MLNIKEILEFRKNNPEPKEVTKIREKILSTFNKLQFVEESHQYFLPDAKGNLIEYDCVSNVTHKFVPHENWDLIAENYAIKHNKPKEQVQEEWHYNNIRATNSGTGVHLYGEMWMELFLGHPDNICGIIKPQYQDGYLLPHSPKEEAVAKFNEDLFRTPHMYPVLAETRVYTGVNKKVKKLNNNYAGTFDILYYFKHPTDDTKSGLLILDYKTNNDLYSKFNIDNNKTLLSPFDDMINQNLSLYTLQLSCYQIPLEDIGMKVLGRRIIWVKPDGSYEKIPVPDVTNVLRNVL